MFGRNVVGHSITAKQKHQLFVDVSKVREGCKSSKVFLAIITALWGRRSQVCIRLFASVHHAEESFLPHPQGANILHHTSNLAFLHFAKDLTTRVSGNHVF